MVPEVTAVITTHARPRHVHEALASVLGETHADLEVIVVDDGGTFVVPADAAGAKVRVVRGAGVGVGRARNLGLDAARGEFSIFLDDDDIAFPHRIASLVAAARQSGASLCFGMTRRSVAGEVVPLPAVPTRLISDGPIAFCDVLTCAPHVNSVLVRTETLRAVGGFDVDAAHFDDWSAWLRIADRNVPMWHVSDVVAEWRIHMQGLSAIVFNARAMKARLIALFDRLETLLSDENARAMAIARQIVEASAILSYDDYVDAIAHARETLHGSGTCLGRPSQFHLRQTADARRAQYAEGDRDSTPG